MIEGLYVVPDHIQLLLVDPHDRLQALIIPALVMAHFLEVHE